MTKNCLTISEIKQITQVFYKETGYDFREYAIGSLKYRLEEIINSYNFDTPDEMINFLKSSKVFQQSFASEIQPHGTEFFRDPEMWKALKKVVFPKILKKEKAKILVPQCAGGEELYSLLFWLQDSDLLDKAEIKVSILSPKSEDFIRKASYTLRKLEQSKKNIELLANKKSFDDYFEQKPDYFRPKIKLPENLTFIKKDVNLLDFGADNFDLILFRNKLIYYNEKRQKEVMRNLSNFLNRNAYIVLGIGEHPGDLFKRRLKEAVKGERIYKRSGL